MNTNAMYSDDFTPEELEQMEREGLSQPSIPTKAIALARCPKCGSAFSDFAFSGQAVYECESIRGSYQSDQCRIRELEIEIAKLNAHLEGYADAFNTQHAEIERLNQMLRETGYEQGQIDAYAAQCEENERLERQNSIMREALEEIRTVSQCRCDEAWTDRGRHDPVCPYDQFYEADEALKRASAE